MPQSTEPPAAARCKVTARDSLLRYSPALVSVAIAIADSVRLADPDLWGHVRFGQLALSQHHLVLRDTFSYSAAGRVVHDHEWLSEIVAATMYNAAGIFGLKLMKLALTAATILFLALAEAETGAPALAQFAILLAVAVTAAPYMQFRPQMFTFALLSGMLLMLARDAYRRTGRLWLAIPILAVWANLHGGFIMGIAALGIYAACCGFQEVASGRGLRRALGLSAVTVAGALATLATPYGLGNWYAIAHALANPYTRIAVADWQPLLRAIARSLHENPAGAIYDLAPLAMMAALATAWLLARETSDLPLVAIAAVMSVAALLSQRNVPIAAIAIAVPLARHVALAMAAGRSHDHAAQSESPRPRVRLANQLVLAAIAIAMLAGTNFFSGRLAATAPYPAGALAFMKEHSLTGKVLNNFLWGEYLIWHLPPESKVFVDGRYDTVYPESVLRQFMLFHFDKPGGADILEQWPHDFVLIAPDSGSNRIMKARAGWKLIYRDDSAMLYARADSRAAGLPGVPFAGAAMPARFP